MKKQSLCRSVSRLALAALLLAGPIGCSTAPADLPSASAANASLSFQDMAPLPVLVSAIDVVNDYNPANDPEDQSAYFPVLPETVLRSYAEARLKPVGQSHILKFVIEDAKIYHELVETPYSGIGDWFGMGRSEKYEINVGLRLYTESSPGAADGTPPSTLTFRRSTHIPANYSIEQREAAQLQFMGELMADIDKAVTATLQQRMRLAGQFLSPPDGAPLNMTVVPDDVRPQESAPAAMPVSADVAVAAQPVSKEALPPAQGQAVSDKADEAASSASDADTWVPTPDEEPAQVAAAPAPPVTAPVSSAPADMPVADERLVRVHSLLIAPETPAVPEESAPQL